MASRIKLGEIPVDVTFKDIKNVHLSVLPPSGRVTISAPRRMRLDAIRVFAVSKLDWIKRQRIKIQSQEREPEREYVDRESHYVWGKRHLLRVLERPGPSGVRLEQGRLILEIRPGLDARRREALVETWCREELRREARPIVAAWEKRLGVELARFDVRRMKTRWGSCNPRRGSILLNTDLARKPRECLEYIVVHELTHLIEPTHNARFVALMDRHLPSWRSARKTLNRLPLRREDWEY
ncbi:MAG: metal-dependent hydrolase [Planctomycetales bacterium 71-10]|nr:MAG: metal-dependent hydrolase [Planctomycetales bacterium 71-10]